MGNRGDAMSGERAFDDDRWPDQEGFAHCFLCGRKVDPRDPHRGSYTAKHLACDPMPIHVPCIVPYFHDGQLDQQVTTLFCHALYEMRDANLKKFLEAAKVATTAPGTH